MNMNTTYNPRNILILIPNYVRDLEGHALVGYHLERSFGHKVHYCNMHEIRSSLLQYTVDAVILDYLAAGGRVRAARLAKEHGAKVVLLPTAGFYQSKADELRRVGSYADLDRILDCVLSWGESFRSVLVSESPIAAEKVHVVGCPRFDLYSKPYISSVVEPRVSFLARLGIHNHAAPIIVWTTNTYFTEARDQKSLMHIPEVKAEFENSREVYQNLSQLVVELARRHVDWNFVIKIHPSEVPDPYRDLPAQLPNIFVAADVSIRDVLYHSDVLVQRWSTTATEAWMLGKPVIEFARGAYHGSAKPEYLKGNHVVDSIEEADLALRAYASGMGIPVEQQLARAAFIRETYFKTDGQASKRCAEKIHELLSLPGYSDEDQARTRRSLLEARTQWLKAEERRFANRVKRLVGLSREDSLRAWLKRFWSNSNDGANPLPWDERISPFMIRDAYSNYDRFLRAPAREPMPTPKRVISGPKVA